MEKKVIRNLGVFSFFLLLVSLVSAYGVGSRFSMEQPMYVYPGQQVEMTLNLQNGIPSDGDMTFSAEITNDANGMVDFAYEDNTYFIPNGERVSVPLVVTVPSDAVLGQAYVARVAFRQVSTGAEGGMISLTGGMDYTFKVIIGSSAENSSFYLPPQPIASEEQTTKSNTVWYLLIGLVIVVILVLALSKKKRK